MSGDSSVDDSIGLPLFSLSLLASCPSESHRLLPHSRVEVVSLRFNRKVMFSVGICAERGLVAAPASLRVAQTDYFQALSLSISLGSILICWLNV